MPMRWMKGISLLLLWSLLSGGALAQDSGWEQFKQRYILSEGRVADTGNHNISHTEGQGFTLLLAVFNDDRLAFDNLWRWTKTTLYQPDTGLFSWRYDPAAQQKVGDKNNASDGDTLIAWALLLAADKWQKPEYRRESRQIQAALIKHTVIPFAGYQIMLPGMNGFNHTSSVILNPSYFLFPAWQAFYRDSRLKVWSDLQRDGLRLLNQMTFGQPPLPADWVTLSIDGKVMPAAGWPPRFSFDAVRIPLYLRWARADERALAPFRVYWQRFTREKTPAWVNVVSGEQAEYPLPGGMMAIRDITLGQDGLVSDRLLPEEDYYSASLHLLAWWAMR
ncbi:MULTISPECIES: glycosyl hydrolase family 8 [unclassified Brenneria]|uniref:glycosyl hydrolase family 8 n=1 Tax=unclassified Brenneria TaxID=2634434 RepID=UPI0029C4CD20|nr:MULTISPECIES: glycosyl hydrolase family 8 [unclassified Brenneria]MDX5628133.1 glycosyl hydrolase family 8 [Brenneria sp. L3-3Z]MDX5694847.1 glycosyl hydrolase family 8 [Brenneria sp. L4-2C]